MERRAVYAIGILVMLVLLVGSVWYLRSRGTGGEAEISAHDLCKALAQGGEAARGEWTGRRVLVEGKVRDINSTGQRSFVLLDGGPSGFGVRAYFGGARAVAITEVKPGSRVKIAGEVGGVQGRAVVLDGCRLEP